MKDEYIKIGAENLKIKKSEIIGIFDLDDSKTTEIQKEFLKRAQQEKRLTAACNDIPKSFLLTRGGGVVLSELSSKSICGRAMESALDRLK